ncbi:MAG: DsbE family thiol:disulfide interchange protein [Pseudomonadota bacterium]
MTDQLDSAPKTSIETPTETAAGGAPPQGGIRPWMIVPALGALGILLTFAVELVAGSGDDLPSTLIDRPAPSFEMAPLYDGQPSFSTADLQGGGVKLVNVWASWCIPCRAEHPWLVALAEERGLTIHGINFKDEPSAAKAFLEELGDPYTLIGTDEGRGGIEWGVYGVPETFVLDHNGVIVFKHIGPITGDTLRKRLLPAIDAAEARTPSG